MSYLAGDKMSRKIFFFDVDNTLVAWPSGEIPSSALYAIKQLQEKGHIIALATGRLQVDAASYAQRLGIKNFVADGGYSVTINDEIHFMESMNLKACREFLKMLDTNDIPWAITIENKTERHTHAKNIAPPNTPWDYYKTIQWDKIDIDNINFLHKIYIFLSAEHEAEHNLDYGSLESIRYGTESLMIEPMAKAYGIKKMIAYYNIEDKDVVTFGDGNNDLSMFEPQWLNIAMGNARQALKDKASYVTTDCDKDGIYNACRHFGWIE